LLLGVVARKMRKIAARHVDKEVLAGDMEQELLPRWDR
jgi:hypothetical protein